MFHYFLLRPLIGVEDSVQLGKILNQDIRQRVVLKLFLSFAKVFLLKGLSHIFIFWANFMK